MHVHKYKYIELLQVLTSIWRWNLWFGLLTLLLVFFPSGMEMSFIGCSFAADRAGIFENGMLQRLRLFQLCIRLARILFE
jgi:signal transduction histidine kinase